MAMTINFANDLGYGSIKGQFLGKYPETIKIPSVTALRQEQDSYDARHFNNDENDHEYIMNLLQHLDVSVDSKSVTHHNRYLLGDAANNSGLHTTDYDVNNPLGKAKQDRTVILTLGAIAGKAVKNYYQEKHTLNNRISANVNMVTSLPPLEGKRNHTTDLYRNRYMKCNHVVSLYNYNHIIKVSIHFNHVIVGLEGEMATYALGNASTDLQKHLLNDFDTNYPKLAGKVKVPDLVNAYSLLSIDIGEGTTDLVLFQNHQITVEGSTSLSEGYGNVYENALHALSDQNIHFRNRAAMKQFMAQGDNPLIASRRKAVKTAVQHQLNSFAADIVRATSGILKNNTGISVIFVYGGGSIPMEHALRKPLVNYTKAFNGASGIAVVFVKGNIPNHPNQSYAQFLNDIGLNIILKQLMQRE